MLAINGIDTLPEWIVKSKDPLKEIAPEGMKEYSKNLEIQKQDQIQNTNLRLPDLYDDKE